MHNVANVTYNANSRANLLVYIGLAQARPNKLCTLQD